MSNKTMDEIVDDVMNDITDRNPSFMANVIRIVEKQWLKEWGERCPEYEPECPCCVAWRKFDKLWAN
jgi:hypothetical protein